MRRAPGDIALKSTPGTSTFRALKDGVPLTTTNISMNLEVDKRPSYPYGNRGMIGNRVWKYPTGYTHYSRTTKSSGTAYVTYNLSGGHKGRDEYINAPIDGIGSVYFDMNSIAKFNTRSAAQVKALNSIASNAANIGEDLATYKQVVHMFGSKASLLKDALYAFKNKKQFANYLNKSAKEIAANGDKMLAGAYLEFVYGWKPLVSDVYNVYQLLKKYSSGIEPVIIHGHGQMTQDTTYQGSGRRTSTSGGFSYTCYDKYTSRCDLYGRVNPDLIAFRMLNQLGLLNPLSFAWEITPWSFVVDWLIPIGPVLSALTAPVGLNFISGSTATRMSRVYEGSFHAGVPEGTYTSDVPVPFTVIDEGYDRVIHTTWPFPTPYLNLDPLAGDHWLKAIALAIVNLKK